jgi:hypothetical protein
VSLELVVDHLVDLLLEEVALLLEERGFLVEARAQALLRHLEVVFDHQEGVLQPIFQKLQFLLDRQQRLLRLRVARTGPHDLFFQLLLPYFTRTIRFFIGTSPIIQL